MAKNELIHITVARIIPARKMQIISVLTKVNEFPSFLPNIKEATIIEKHHNKIKTRWKIQIDNLPISWLEEDTLFLKKNSIQFNAIEGDLTIFRGEWTFTDHPEGTEVSVAVTLQVGIPAIQEFTNTYIPKLVTRNFECILEGIEKKIISRRYESFKKGNIDKIAGFGIIGHPYNLKHLEKCFTKLNPQFVMPSFDFLAQLFHITPSFKLYDIKDFRSASGKTTNGSFIIATFIPDMIEKDIWTVFSKVVRACKIAEKHGIGIVSLGGFTSIVAERIGHEISQEVDIAVTSGNTFTAAMTIDGVLKAAQLVGIDIESAKLTIVGGTGDIGSACARVFAGRVKQLVITGRTPANLSALKAELNKIRKAEIVATTDNRQAIKNADLVVCVASATSAIVDVAWFKPGAIVCDVGYPKNISYAPTTRTDILIFSGGLAKIPTPIYLPLDLGLPSPHTLYGCFSEGIILSLEKRFENFSFGRGNITPEKINEIRDMGCKHGFEVADFYWGNTPVSSEMIHRVQVILKHSQ